MEGEADDGGEVGAAKSVDANAASSGGDRRVLFLLSSRLAFQVREALAWKEFYTAETVRRMLDAKECRRLLTTIHKGQLLIRTELKLNQWAARDYARCHKGIHYGWRSLDNTPRISASTNQEFLEKHEAVGGKWGRFVDRSTG